MRTTTLLGALVAGANAFDIQIPLSSQDDSVPASANSQQLTTASKPLVSTKELQASIHKENLFKKAEKLFDIAKLSEDEYNHPTRVIGSAGHEGTIDYITSEIAKLDGYYSLSNQSFPAYMGRVFESRLVLGDGVPKSGQPMSLTPPTRNNEPVHGDIALVDNEGCDEGDYLGVKQGDIALILRGTCPFGTKSELAGKAGAVAAIVYNYEKGEVHGTLGVPSPYHVATFGLSKAEAGPVIKELKSGNRVDAIAYIDGEVKTVVTNNVVAQTVEGDAENCVMLGGHSDSVTEGPGINDDGSGSLSLLEVAQQLTKFSVNNCVRFAWWAGEEEGLLGSDYYVAQLSEEENMKIRLFMDYDMMGSPNFAYQVYNATNKANPTGSEELRDLYVDWYDSQDLSHTFIPFDGRSDYDAFIRNGIPGGGIATGAEGIKSKDEEKMFGGKAGDWYDPCYHQLCDDLSNVNQTAWEVNTKLIAHSVASFAVSFDGFPERTKESLAVNSYDEEPKYHGRYMYI